ncbi:LADA_0F07316g1_1 [Lachancea dasiensis]|uniref:LADA_0F07316g1_1 n=1 Tax=Lachancea dasiensis TaxID=1072105 RepID=A0A1G4JK74_9SACH|nr:LADA_0F07316g1_1 [Lachancea dasiensis]
MTDSGYKSPSSTRSSEPARKARKTRVRLSLVCRNCRRRKIKCDRVQPTCGTCAKLHAECVYDYADQLEKRYSVGKAYSLGERLDELEHKFKDLRQGLKSEQLGNRGWRNDLYKQPVKVNFFDGLQPNSLTSIFKCDHKPFSDMGMIQKHKRLNHFLKFVTKSYKPLNYVVGKIVQSVGDDIDPHSDELDSVVQVLFLAPEIREILRKNTMNSQDLSPEAVDAIRRCLLGKGDGVSKKALFEPIDLEFHSSKTTPQELIDEIINILPSKKNIDRLLSYYMENVYPLVPYIDKTRVLSTVLQSIQYSPSGVVVGLNIGDHQDFARKTGCLAILLVLMRISYTAMMLVNISFEVEISNHFIRIAQKCLAHLITLSHKTNEDILSCLILMRWALLYFPTEGDVMAGSIRDMLMTLIIKHAFKIGLYRDCIEADHHQGTDERTRYFLHFRAKLWMGTLILLRSDMYLRGNFLFLGVDYAHMAPKEEDIEKYYEDDTEIEIHKVLHKQLHIFGKMSVLDRLSLQLREGSDIDDIYPKIRWLEYELQSCCPLSEVNGLVGAHADRKVLQGMRNALYFKVNVIARIYFLAIRASVVCNIEDQIRLSIGKSEWLSLTFRKVTEECFESALELGDILQTYMRTAGDSNEGRVLPDHRYIINQLVQNGVFRVAYYLIGVILTVLRVKEELKGFRWQTKNRPSLEGQIDYKVSIIDSISYSIFQYVQKMVNLGSNTLSNTYFTSFKQFLFLEYAMQIIRNEINPGVSSRLNEMMDVTDIPACIDYSTADWEKFSGFVSAALGAHESQGFFPTTGDFSVTNMLQVPENPLDQSLNPILLFDDDSTIQNMLDGDYTWTDFI